MVRFVYGKFSIPSRFFGYPARTGRLAKGTGPCRARSGRTMPSGWIILVRSRGGNACRGWSADTGSTPVSRPNSQWGCLDPLLLQVLPRKAELDPHPVLRLIRLAKLPPFAVPACSGNTKTES